jgi:hypothetical protein
MTEAKSKGGFALGDYCNAAMSGGLPLSHPRGLRGCKHYADPDRPHIPGTDYYDGRDGSIEADDGLTDDERIEAQDAREEWTDFLEWQKGLGA